MSKQTSRSAAALLIVVGAIITVASLGLLSGHTATTPAVGYFPGGFGVDSVRLVIEKCATDGTQSTSVVSFTDTSVHDLTYAITYNLYDYNRYWWEAYLSGDSLPVITKRNIIHSRGRTGNNVNLVNRLAFPTIVPDSVKRAIWRGSSAVGTTVKWTSPTSIRDTVQIVPPYDTLLHTWVYSLYVDDGWISYYPIEFMPANARDTITDTISLDTVVISTGGIVEAGAVDTFQLVVYDRENNTAVGWAPVTVRTSPGNQEVGSRFTNLNGQALAVLIGAGNDYRVTTAPVLYNGADTVIDSLTGTDTVFVTKIDAAANTVLLWGRLGPAGAYAQVYASLEGGGTIQNICDSSLVLQRVFRDIDGADAGGNFYIRVPYSSCIKKPGNDSTYYKLVASRSGAQIFSTPVYARDTTVQRVF